MQQMQPQPETEREASGGRARDTLVITGMDCAECALKVERGIGRLPGVASVRVNFTSAKLQVEYDTAAVGRETIIDRIEGLGYGVAPSAPLPAASPAKTFWIPWASNPRVLTTAAAGLFLAVAAVLSHLGVTRAAVPDTATHALYLAAIVVGGYYPARSGVNALRTSRTLDTNLLTSVAAIGAAAIGQWTEGATVIFLFSVGEALESYAMERTRRSIRSLVELAPGEAVVRRGGREFRLPVREIVPGDAVLIRPGERIPVDGQVTQGASSVNQAPITGESVPSDKSSGDEVYAGTINLEGALEVRVTRLAEDTSLARIIRMVEDAQARQAPSQRYVDAFARHYTPAVVAGALAIAGVPPLFFGQPLGPWLYRALALLVVSCPCALVISTPVSIVSAIANAARNGVLIKGGAYLEQAGSIRVVAFDKTGTLTVGEPEVTDVIPALGHSAEEVLTLAAAVEARSEHPLGRAINRRAAAAAVEAPPADHFAALPGRGARAETGGREVYVGSLRLFEELGVATAQAKEVLDRLQGEGKTAVVVGTQAETIGVVAVADQLRETSHATIRGLKEAAVRRVVMLTGDNEATAAAIGRTLGIDEYRADLLPADKVAAVERLRRDYGKVAMVGDGINDAPALAAASVGIAMGTGTGTALETADIALMSNDLRKLPYTIRLSRRTLGIVKQNIGFALAVKLLAVAAVFPGWLTLWLAVLADTGASLVVIANGLRLLR